ncbi:MAG TPA: beta-L-arabinofuranosidase domain-containing protein, partial [Gemmatimonadaceae bacterium]
MALTAASTVKPFDLRDVRLLDGPFRAAQQRNARYLLSLDPDRMLHNFRVNAGLAPKAPVYGGWESVEPWIGIRCHGHTAGHYLSAVAMMFASTGDAEFSRRAAYIVSELRTCQRARGDGLVSAFPDGSKPLDDAIAGRPFPGVPWYTMHKIFAGLRDAHVHAATPDALATLVDLAEWTHRSTREMNDAEMQTMLDTEHGGMTEVLADVSALANEPKYLTLARRFAHQKVLIPLADGRDTLDSLHANTQIPKFIGFQRVHELDRDATYGASARYFWQTVTERRSYATGGNGDGEHFFPVTDFAKRLGSAKTMETCCTHNMLRLTRALFAEEPSATYADYYERALYNGILASQDPDSGMMTYFQATRPGYLRLYHTPEDSFWCCTGSGIENHAKYGDSIYFHDAESLYVNLFIPSRLTWPARGMVLAQETRFPDADVTRLTIERVDGGRIPATLLVRRPHWCERMIVSVNGRRVSANVTPAGYVPIRREWRL